MKIISMRTWFISNGGGGGGKSGGGAPPPIAPAAPPPAVDDSEIKLAAERAKQQAELGVQNQARFATGSSAETTGDQIALEETNKNTLLGQ